MNSINNYNIEDTYVLKINLNNFNLFLNKNLNNTFDDVIFMNKKEYSKLLLEKSGIIVNKNEIKKNKNKCPICFDDIKINHKTYMINTCNHLYHYKCIKKWFEQNSTCPICRVSSESCVEI